MKLKFNKDIRLTLDFPEDKFYLTKIYKYFKIIVIYFRNVFIKAKPFLIKINSHHKIKV